MIPSIVKIPVSVAQYLVVTVARGGLGVAASLLHRVLPGGDVEDVARSRTATSPSAPETSPVVDVTPPKPRVSAEPATTTPAAKATAKRATARKGPVKPPAARKAPTKPAAVLDEPVAPVEEDTVVYSSGPDVAVSITAEDLTDS